MTATHRFETKLLEIIVDSSELNRIMERVEDALDDADCGIHEGILALLTLACLNAAPHLQEEEILDMVSEISKLMAMYMSSGHNSLTFGTKH